MSFGYQVLGFGSGADAAAGIVCEYLIVAGGGSGGNNDFHGGGGGAGGFRTNVGDAPDYRSGVVYTVTVGEGGITPSPGGNGNNFPGGVSSLASDDGSDTISSAGGGRGGLDTIQGSQDSPGQLGGGGDGGSGGGTALSPRPGLGNVPATTPAQGTDGNVNAPTYRTGGGGGASQAGISPGGIGGDGTSSDITGSAITYAGGGGGAGYPSGAGGPGGAGGGGAGSAGNGIPGTNGLGGGGGGAERQGTGGGGNGGDGVVFLKMLDGDYSGITTGSPTVSTGQDPGGAYTVIKYLADGTYTS